MKINARGFSMVELAVVMIVIGISVGGVLMARGMMANARVNKTISQVMSYQMAIDTFRKIYDEMPGDYPTAVGTLAGCAGNTTCANGDGNGMVGVLVPGASALGAPYADVDVTVAGENTQFWKHLAAAQLIEGVIPAAATADWGATNPTGPFIGGFFAREVDYSTYKGLVLLMRGNIQGRWNPGNTTKSLAPKFGGAIDRKIDDGLAYTGTVLAASSGFNTGCGGKNSGSNGPTGYGETITQEVCDMFFVMK